MIFYLPLEDRLYQKSPPYEQQNKNSEENTFFCLSFNREKQKQKFSSLYNIVLCTFHLQLRDIL